MSTSSSLPAAMYATLRRFVRKREQGEVCELCGLEVLSGHQHLVEVAQKRLLCACDACAILFGADGLKYKRVPRRVSALENFQMSDGQWESLMIPIGVAFFFRSTTADRVVVLYPSPAGAVESLLPCETWEGIANGNPLLSGMQADVEGLLVNRLAHARGEGKGEYYLVPIDACFRLVGLIRANWKGLSGGPQVWQEIHTFFDELKSSANRKNRESCA